MSARVVDLYRYQTTRTQVVTPERTNVLRLGRARPVVRVEVPSAWAFPPGGAVLVPIGGQPDPLVPLAAALLHRAGTPASLLLVVGHADAEALSLVRARSVLGLLRGDRAAWTAEAALAASVADAQAALAWAARTRGWACDPGPIDGLDGPRTRAGAAAFRGAVLAVRGRPRPPDGPFGAADWAAVFDEYVLDLAALLGREPACPDLALVGDGARGCAAAWPPDRVRMEGHATTDAGRVDLLFFAPGDAPALECHAGPACDWRRCDVYRKGKYFAVPPDLAPPSPPAPELALRLLDARGGALDRVAVRFTLPDRSAEVATDALGWARVPCAPGAACGARVVDPDALGLRLDALGAPATVHEPGPGAVVLERDEAGVHVPLEPGAPRTVVLRGEVRCVEAPGSTFEHAQSFPGPDVAALAPPLRALLDARPARRAMLFGHTDPTGKETYNKGLSERRAEAVHAVLTRDPEAFERLWDGPEKWFLDPHVRRQLLTTAGYSTPPDASTHHEAEQLTRFQQDRGLAPTYAWTGAATRPTRLLLFAAYMAALVPEPLDAARLVGPPASSRPWMGCGEWNPFVPSTPAVRDAPSRRCVALVAAPAALPAPPCLVGDLAPCRAEELAPDERGPPTPHFRCRAYRTAAASCPCGQEGADDGAPYQVWFRAQDEDEGRPLPGVRFALEGLADGRVLARGTADAAGEARVLVSGAGSFRVRLGERTVHAGLVVVDADTGEAVAGAALEVAGPGDAVARGFTDGAGRVDLDLAVGVVRVRAADGREGALTVGDDAAAHVLRAPVRRPRPEAGPPEAGPEGDDGG